LEEREESRKKKKISVVFLFAVCRLFEQPRTYFNFRVILIC